MRHVSLALRNLLFSVVVPGLGAILAPWWILSRTDPSPAPTSWAAIAPIVAGGILYVVCVWQFAVVGRGTPGPWDPPRRFVAVGPYRWVRNPIYVAALMVVFGEAWLFASVALFLYAGLMASLFHLFVIGYEEPTLRRRFGERYSEYVRTVPRWVPRIPRRG
jgi:protein-S-isoprenylcysteine O-methyltransferase Ste14